MAKRRGNMKDIKIKEVSLVDLPANKLSFLFFKRDGDQPGESLDKAKKIKIAIESNGTAKGTIVTINGDKMENLRDFNFSFYGIEKDSPVSCSYSKVVEAEDGFKRTESFYLSKGKVMDEKTLKVLQAYLGTDEIDFEKKVGEEDIQKALTLINKEYKETFPEDLENAVGVIAKRAASSYDVKEDDKNVEKAGAKFSKDVLKKLKSVLAAVEALKSILPDMKESTEKSGGSDEMDELTKQVAELKDAIAKFDPEKKGDDKSVAAKLTETLGDISKRLKALEDGGAAKKSITGDDDDNDDNEPKGAGENGKHLWGSITGHSKK